MSVAASLKLASLLQAKVQRGKQGVKRPDRGRIEEGPPRRVVDSLDLDAALKATSPADKRWDYLLGTTLSDQELVGVEVHPANTGEARVVIAKKMAAQVHLRSHLAAGAHVQAWYWVATGANRITRTTPEWRRLVSAGILLVGRKLLLG